MKANRERARCRRLAARIAYLVPALVALGLDVFERGALYGSMLRADFAALFTTWTFSLALWTCAVVTASRRRLLASTLARLVIAIIAAAAALQAAAYEYFAATIDYSLLRSAWHLEGMMQLARPFVGTILRWTITATVASLAWTFVVPRIARPRRRVARTASWALPAIMTLALATSFLPHVSTDAAPDVLALSSLARFAVVRPRSGPSLTTLTATPEIDFRRTVAAVPPAEPRLRRNVLFIVTESVRASAVCSGHAAECPHNPFSNAVAPKRLPLERMRAVDSFTLLSFGILFSGLSVLAPRNDWLTAPLLFDYAHAAHVTTAYWTAHHPDFANSHEWTDGEPIDRLAWGTDFDPKADKVLGADDVHVTDRALAELPTLAEPFFAVVHFAGTHFPYRVDSDAPFRPISNALDRHAPEGLRNKYFDAIYKQDKLTAQLLKAVRAMSFSDRTVIVFISDHGESFYEHGSVLHGSSLWDDELRVPAWIDAPEGLLTSTELASLRATREVPVTEEDVAPTILDLLGIANVPVWRALTTRMPGTSLLRSPAAKRETPIATCNALWSCFVPSSGKLIGDLKWVTRPPDPYRCFDTVADPEEQNDLGAAACGQ